MAEKDDNGQYTLTAGYLKPKRRFITNDAALRFWPGWMLFCARKCRPFPGGLPEGYSSPLGHYRQRWWRFYRRVNPYVERIAEVLFGAGSFNG